MDATNLVQNAPQAGLNLPETETLQLDWEALRKESLGTGGFGERRASLWPLLLGVRSISQTTTVLTEEEDTSLLMDGEVKAIQHPDERQIKLDTDRSFVLYPEDNNDQRDTLQDGLHHLLVSLFRKRRKLGYFQGYHDIITVLYLTVSPEVRLACAEKISLHRVRDSMGTGLEPVLGLLRITRNLLRLVDKPYAEVLERASPLPFYALSNLLTLFSHDMPSLSLIQHVFDYLLCRPPIAVVYLAAVIILERKDEVLRLESEGEDGMIHSLLSNLPDLEDGEDADETDTQNILAPIIEHTTSEPLASSVSPPSALVPDSELTGPCLSGTPVDFPTRRQSRRASESSTENRRLSRSRSGRSRALSNLPTLPDHVAVSASSHPSRSVSRSRTPRSSRSSSRASPLFPPASPAETPPPYPDDDGSRPKSKPKMSLSDLLARADQLREKFPMHHPDLQVSKIMGPQSVIFTWSEPHRASPSTDEEMDEDGMQDPDDAAEAMVLHPELVVYPYDPSSEDMSKENKHPENEDGQLGNDDQKRKRRKLQKSRHLELRTRTIVAGAVIVLGVAMATYGIRASQRGGAIHHLHATGHVQKKWTHGQHWFGGAVAGATMKLVHAFGLGDNGGRGGDL